MGSPLSRRQGKLRMTLRASQRRRVIRHPAAHARHMQGEQCQANEQQALRREHHAGARAGHPQYERNDEKQAAMYPSMAHSSGKKGHGDQRFSHAGNAAALTEPPASTTPQARRVTGWA
jgi:hypothetical protein